MAHEHPVDAVPAARGRGAGRAADRRGGGQGEPGGDVRVVDGVVLKKEKRGV